MILYYWIMGIQKLWTAVFIKINKSNMPQHCHLQGTSMVRGAKDTAVCCVKAIGVT